MNLGAHAAIGRNIALVSGCVIVSAFAFLVHADATKHNALASAIRQETALIRTEIRATYEPVCNQWERLRIRELAKRLSDAQTSQLERVCAANI